MEREDVGIGAPPVHEGETVLPLPREILGGGEGHRPDLELHADLLQARLHDLKHVERLRVLLDVDHRLEPDAVLRPGPVRTRLPPGLIEDLTRLRGIVPVHLLHLRHQSGVDRAPRQLRTERVRLRCDERELLAANQIRSFDSLEELAELIGDEEAVFKAVVRPEKSKLGGEGFFREIAAAGQKGMYTKRGVP